MGYGQTEVIPRCVRPNKERSPSPGTCGAEPCFLPGKGPSCTRRTCGPLVLQVVRVTRGGRCRS